MAFPLRLAADPRVVDHGLVQLGCDEPGGAQQPSRPAIEPVERRQVLVDECADGALGSGVARTSASLGAGGDRAPGLVQHLGCEVDPSMTVTPLEASQRAVRPELQPRSATALASLHRTVSRRSSNARSMRFKTVSS